MITQRISYPIEFKYSISLIKEIEYIISCAISIGEYKTGKISHTTIEDNEFIVYLEIELQEAIGCTEWGDSLLKLLKF